MGTTKLVSDLFPQGVVLRLEHDHGIYTVRWNYKHKAFEIKANSLEEVLRETIGALRLLDQQDPN